MLQVTRTLTTATLLAMISMNVHANTVYPAENNSLSREWNTLLRPLQLENGLENNLTNVEVIFTIDKDGILQILNAQAMNESVKSFVIQKLNGWQSNGLLHADELYRVTIQFRRL